jgi:AcrR family transcriptional regulator
LATVQRELVEAAVATARRRDQAVAEVPLAEIAKAAGISRSTLLRRIGTRARLDEAVREAGIDPGSRMPVRERAVTAAARLLADHGLGALTLDAVADAASCAVPSLHVTFGNRDGLLTAVFDRFGPVPELEQLVAERPVGLDETVNGIYRILIAAFTNDPAVLPALFADLLARPEGPAGRVVRATLPSLVVPLDALLTPHVRAGRLRAMPLPLLVQLLVGPLVSHMLTRPALQAAMPTELPTLAETRTTFAEAFLRAGAP